MDKLRSHSPVLVEQALLVSQELIRVAILWHEIWMEQLEEASRLYFIDRNFEAMFQILDDLQTYKMSFNQYAFGSNNITTDGTIFGVLIKSINGKVVFIDYDWVDENGKAIYPPFLNLGIPRHHDASPGGRIVKEHDEFMVNRYKH
ncbi:13533_t:CDS:2 [Entrophospora sp. SA101]|nr:13533_t:CDS:2 [Entrophospora sp. SA101]